MVTYRSPAIGEAAPHFHAETTSGTVNFPEDYKGRWVILFSYFGDFSPVCATEMMALANSAKDFSAHGCDLLGLSVDSAASHIQWTRAMENYNWNDIKKPRVTFPLIADDHGEVSRLYGILPDDSQAGRTSRHVYYVDPQGVLRAVLAYPVVVGRNTHEMLRLLLALQAVDASGYYTPCNWVPGDDLVYSAPHTTTGAQKLVEEKQDKGCVDWYLCFTKGAAAPPAMPSAPGPIVPPAQARPIVPMAPRPTVPMAPLPMAPMAPLPTAPGSMAPRPAATKAPPPAAPGAMAPRPAAPMAPPPAAPGAMAPRPAAPMTPRPAAPGSFVTRPTMAPAAAMPVTGLESAMQSILGSQPVIPQMGGPAVPPTGRPGVEAPSDTQPRRETPPPAPTAPGMRPAPPSMGSGTPRQMTPPPPSAVQPPKKEFTAEELAKYTGKGGFPPYGAVNGTVYDLTSILSSPTHMSLQPGGDLTKEFTTCHMGMTYLLNRLPAMGVLTARPSVPQPPAHRPAELNLNDDYIILRDFPIYRDHH